MTLNGRTLFLRKRAVQHNFKVPAVHALQAHASLGPWEFNLLPSSSDAKTIFPEVACSALLPLTGWRSSFPKALTASDPVTSLETFCLRVREDIHRVN
jgi:hypothetical protein